MYKKYINKNAKLKKKKLFMGDKIQYILNF